MAAQTLDISFPGFEWTHTEATTRLTVPPGVTRSVDVARVHETPADQRWNDRLELMIHPEPANQRHLLAEGTYDLEVVLSARNADARRYGVRVAYSGRGPLTQRIQILDAPRRLPDQAAAARGERRLLGRLRLPDGRKRSSSA